MNVILSRGFAGSERAAVEACAALARRHDVALVVRSDHRDRSGVSLLDELEPGIEVFEVPPRWRTQQRLAEIIEQWRPDIIHTHLRRGTRYVARIKRTARHVSTLHLHLNGPHYLRTDALFCISDWQLATVPAAYHGRTYLVPNSLVPHPRLPPERIRQLRAELGAGDDDFLIGGGRTAGAAQGLRRAAAGVRAGAAAAGEARASWAMAASVRSLRASGRRTACASKASAAT